MASPGRPKKKRALAVHLQLAQIDSFWLPTAPRFVDFIAGRSLAVAVWLVFVGKNGARLAKLRLAALPLLLPAGVRQPVQAVMRSCC